MTDEERMPATPEASTSHSYPGEPLYVATDDLTRALEVAEELRVLALPYSGPHTGTLNRAEALLRRLVERCREVEKVERFAGIILREHRRDMDDVDGGDVQEWAIKTGLLGWETRVAPCDEECHCAEYHDEGPTQCLRLTPLGERLWEVAL